MKKNKLKLSLKKRTISNFQTASIKGGSTESLLWGISLVDIGTMCNSAHGCTDGPDETMTCAEWSCGCGGEELVIEG